MAEKIWIAQLRVTVLGTRPRVWRRLGAPVTIRLGQLHEVIQISMGWTGKFKHRFFAGDKALLPAWGDTLEDVRIASQEGLRCLVPKKTWSGKPTGLKGEDEDTVHLEEVCREIKDRLYYEYEVGDGWGLSIEVQQLFKAKLHVEYPRCMTGCQASPPEGCGGAERYRRLLEALGRPEDARHREAIRRLGEYFDPVKFDKAWVNERLAMCEGEKVYKEPPVSEKKKKKKAGVRQQEKLKKKTMEKKKKELHSMRDLLLHGKRPVRRKSQEEESGVREESF